MKTVSLAAALALGACAPPLHSRATPPDGTTAGPLAPSDSGAPADTGAPSACPEDPARFADFEAGLAAIPTVARVRWTTTTAAQGRLLVRDADGHLRETEPEATAATDHSHTLVGLHQLSAYTLQVALDTPDGPVCSPPLSLETGSLPASLPAVTAEVAHADDSPGYTLTPIIAENSLYAAIIDNTGAYVWARVIWEQPEGSGGPPPPGTHPIIFRVVPSPDGRGVIVNTQGEATDEPGDLVQIDWDGQELDRRSFTGGHTDFALRPDGGAAMLGWTIRSFGERKLLGDTILVQEPSGETTVLWDAFDHLVPDLGRRYNTGFMPAEGDIEDWSHVNSIWYDAETDDYYVTITANNGVARVDAQTGATTWVLADDSDDFSIAAEKTIHSPHSVQRIDDELLVFNRRNPGDPASCSGPTVVAIDEAAQTAEETWRWEGGGCLHVGFLGNSQRMPDGATVTSWSHLGMMDEVSAAGDLVWRVRLGIGAAFGFSHRVPTLAGAAQ